MGIGLKAREEREENHEKRVNMSARLLLTVTNTTARRPTRECFPFFFVRARVRAMHASSLINASLVLWSSMLRPSSPLQLARSFSL